MRHTFNMRWGLSACVLVSLLIVSTPPLHGQGGAAVRPAPTIISPLKNDRWMTEIARTYPDYGQLQLGQALFPGSHDAGAYAPLTFLFAPDASPFLTDLQFQVPGFISFIPEIHGWSTAQSGNFANQLQAVVRYFYIRVCAPPFGGTEPRPCHGFWGPDTIDTLLVQVRDFLAGANRSKEIVILHFQDFSDNFSEGMHTKILD